MNRRPRQNCGIGQRIEFATQCIGALVVIVLLTLVETSAQVYFQPGSVAVEPGMQANQIAGVVR